MRISNHPTRGFHLRVDSFEEFQALVAFIRGDTDEATIREMTGKLTASTAALKHAQQAATVKPQKKE